MELQVDTVKFGELAKKTKAELVVSRRHEEWLSKNSNPWYSEKALDFGRKQLFEQGNPRKRQGTVSASSLGSCMRKQVFTYLGWLELAPSSKAAQIFHNGTFMHIRWQMAGLTEGWLVKAEVPVPRPNTLRLSGTQDGIAYDGSVVELKSINSYGFSGVNTFGPKSEHLLQAGAYMLTTGAKQTVFIYENKDTQEYKEIVTPLDDDMIENVTLRANALWEHIDNQTLPEPLSKCIDKEGWEYNSCPFRDRCLLVQTWKEAEETT